MKLATVLILVVLLALGANWLFKQRSVDEIKVAKDWIDAMRKK